MFQKWTNCFLIIVIAIFVSLTFNLPARAKDCGGNIPCECGDSVIANRTIKGDPVANTICTGTGLFMNTDGVTLIMKKSKLFGSPDPHAQLGAGDGISINADNVTIQGGRIEGFQHGIIGTTNDSTILQVNSDHNAVNGIKITGDRNTIEDSMGAHVLGAFPGDGILVIGNDNDLIDTYTQKTASGWVGLRVIGSGNFLHGNFVDQGVGGGIWVTGDGVIDGNNIDGGGNKASKVTGTPKCEIDGFACLP